MVIPTRYTNVHAADNEKQVGNGIGHFYTTTTHRQSQRYIRESRRIPKMIKMQLGKAGNRKVKAGRRGVR